LYKRQGGLGEGFEKVILSSIQKKFHEILQSQHGGDAAILKKLRVPDQSAYGVLALKCNDAHERMNWIESATKSCFEGQIPPFYYPDTAIGPDLIFMMWDSQYKSYMQPICMECMHNQLQTDHHRTAIEGISIV
jgi:hypothetical protein